MQQFTHGDSLRTDRFDAECHAFRQRSPPGVRRRSRYVASLTRSLETSGSATIRPADTRMMFSVREYAPTASRSDSDELLSAFLAIWNAPENLRCLSFSLEPFEELQVRDWFDNAASDHIRYFAAVTNTGAIAGISVLRMDPISPFEILGLAARPDSQNVGVGRLLVSHTLELAKSVGSSCVEAAVFADNMRMLRLLLSSGFIPVRIDYHRRADGGDLVVLQRREGEQ